MEYVGPVTSCAGSQYYLTSDMGKQNKKKLQLRAFSNERNSINGKIRTPVTSNGWYMLAAAFIDVANGLKSIIGQDLFDQHGHAVTQPSSQKANQVINFSPHRAKYSSSFHQNLKYRIGSSENRVAKSKFHEQFQPRHQKGKWIPYHKTYLLTRQL